ncbi:hypothetical protein CEXT_120781 [Caerostris extrusa]|uniref:Uncharacterized protein n=1 Tax=Caerostris extrusa TaxID=172846 RepID=A0AAV4PTG9_CAEEX|nr:hypothetical protein CEXT_120781 [Caerostris extrusa]
MIVEGISESRPGGSLTMAAVAHRSPIRRRICEYDLAKGRESDSDNAPIVVAEPMRLMGMEIIGDTNKKADGN